MKKTIIVAIIIIVGLMLFRSTEAQSFIGKNVFRTLDVTIFNNPVTDSKGITIYKFTDEKNTCYGAYTTTKIQNQDVVGQATISCVK
jgi:hypothetical protein